MADDIRSGAEAPSLAELTTMRVGGFASRLIAPDSSSALVEAVRAVWAEGEPWLLLGGGSNMVVSDEGVEGTVIRVVTRGVERLADGVPDGVVRLRVQAGESWDELVGRTVSEGWAGLEALSGIPGSCGAAPVQNIGAYGQELSSSLVAVDFLDYGTGELTRLDASELELGYRSSVFKHGRAGLVLAIELELVDESDRGALSQPIAYSQLASALGVALGERVSLRGVRDAVLALRASKGMVLDPDDQDSASAGSFFTNPLVSEAFARGLPAGAPRWPTVAVLDAPAVTPLAAVAAGAPIALPRPRVEEAPVKLSAAWLIEKAGIARGFALPGSRAAVSSKHTLALTNRGGATAAEVAELARFIQGRVLSEFGVILQPEPMLVGLSL